MNDPCLILCEFTGLETYLEPISLVIITQSRTVSYAVVVSHLHLLATLPITGHANVPSLPTPHTSLLPKCTFAPPRPQCAVSRSLDSEVPWPNSTLHDRRCSLNLYIPTRLPLQDDPPSLPRCNCFPALPPEPTHRQRFDKPPESASASSPLRWPPIPIMRAC